MLRRARERQGGHAGISHARGHMRSFISECCEASEKPGTHGRTRKELYGAWRDWNEQNGTQAGASSRFYERLASVATEVYGWPIRERKSNGQRLFDGLRLV